MANGSRRIDSGTPYPLGAHWTGNGANFALFSENAEKVELCLFDASGQNERERIPLPEYTDQIWHGFLPGLPLGTLYGYRVYGPYDPEAGHRFNHHKLLVDPYARQLHGPMRWSFANFGYRIGDTEGDLSFDTRDNARSMPKGVVIADREKRGAPGPRHLQLPLSRAIVYEAHITSMTARHHGVDKHLRGKCAGLATPAIIDHLVDMGVTAIELLPIYAYFDERHLVEKGLRNYWGYNPYNFFAADPRLLDAGGIDEVRMTVDALHEAGIEVILDVVYNHSGEGDHLGPTLSLRGIDNKSYYRLLPGNERYYINDTGCGNTLNVSHPRVQQMVMDSLRYWAQEVGIDGFRFDLAATVARDDEGFNPRSALLDQIQQDPALARLKLIAEPWDIGPGGYQLGGFPPGWSEWNDRYRDCVRGFWRGDQGQVPELASCLAGSSNLFHHQGRRPQASINFVTAHDGFTLTDLVSYNDKHNQANKENNRDGHNNNLSWNCGIEGPTDDPDILALRHRQKRNIMATLLLSQGVPMILGGDELGRTQRGNNNAYCQDNEINWYNWDDLSEEDLDFLDFVKRVLAIRRRHPSFRRCHFFTGQPLTPDGVKDITWLRPDGAEMADTDWSNPYAHCLGFHMLPPPAEGAGDEESASGLILLLNAYREPIPFVLPPEPYGHSWTVLLDTSEGWAQGRNRVAEEEIIGKTWPCSEAYPLAERSLVVLAHRKP